MRAGHTHYTPPAGIPELKQALADLYSQTWGLSTQPDQVVISNGAKQSIHNALMALCGPGDEVIIPAPYWVSYADLVKLTGATPVIVATTEESGFKLTPDQFAAAVTPRTKLLMLNSPSNPTGVVYAGPNSPRWPMRCSRRTSRCFPTRSTSSSSTTGPRRPASPRSGPAWPSGRSRSRG